VYPLAKDCLYRNGITNPEINKKRSRNVVKKDKDDFDYILVAEDDNLNGVLRVIGNDASDKVFKILDFADDGKRKGKDIDDPWYTRNFDKSFSDIMLGCKGFLNYLKKNKEI
jgi:protein-tyrosine phosphatase